VSGIDFIQMNGLDALIVQTILSEVGLDPKRFPVSSTFVPGWDYVQARGLPEASC
jgi:transposase